MLATFSPLRVRSDDRGSLVALQSGREIAQPIAQVYYVFGGKPDTARGFHAHKRLVQHVVCLQGSCRIVLDNWQRRESVNLDGRDKALLLDKLVWHEIYDMSPDCILAIHASEPHDEDDYIRDYLEFTETVGGERVSPYEQ